MSQDLNQPIPPNPFDARFRPNPHALYHYMRTVDPVHSSEVGAWVLTRYADCLAVLRDPRFSHDFRKARGFPEFLAAGGEMAPLQRMMTGMMLFQDPPDHTRLRSLVQKAFTPKVVARMKPRITEMIDALLASALERGSMDVIADFSHPLPVMVIAEMLGVPAADSPKFEEWAGLLRPILDPIVTVEAGAAATAAQMAFVEYLVDLVERRRAEPADDLLSGLIAAEEGGHRLTSWELISNIILLLVAGHETTMNTIATGLYVLLQNPDQLELLRGDPSLAASAVEEVARYEGPVHLTGRNALEDVEVGGRVVPAGDHVLTILAAANRDPAQFPEPDRLDIRRKDNGHLGFGHGTHFCIGAPLARLEVPAALVALTRLPILELEEEPTWRTTVTLRGLTALKVRVAAR